MSTNLWKYKCINPLTACLVSKKRHGSWANFQGAGIFRPGQQDTAEMGQACQYPACVQCPEYNGPARCFSENDSPRPSNWNKWTANPDGRVIVHMEIGLLSSRDPAITVCETISLPGWDKGVCVSN